MRNVSILILTLMLVLNVTVTIIAGPTCPPVGAPLMVEKIDLSEEILLLDSEGTPKPFNKYLYNHAYGQFIDLDDVYSVVLLSYWIPGVCDVWAKMSAVTVNRASRISYKVKERDLGGGEPIKIINTLISLSNLPEYEVEYVWPINGHILPDKYDNVVVIAANGRKYATELTQLTVALIMDRWGDIFYLPLYYDDHGLGAPSLQQNQSTEVVEIPQEIMDLFPVISPQGTRTTTWGAIKSQW